MNPFTCSSNSKRWSGKTIRYGSELSRAGPRSSLPPLVVPPPPTVDHDGAYTPGATYHSSGSGDRTKHVCLSLVGHTLRRPLSTTGQVLMCHCSPLGRSPSCNRLGEHLAFFNRERKALANWKTGRLRWVSLSSFPKSFSQLGNIFLPPWSHSLANPPPWSIRLLNVSWSLWSPPTQKPVSSGRGWSAVTLKWKWPRKLPELSHQMDMADFNRASSQILLPVVFQA